MSLRKIIWFCVIDPRVWNLYKSALRKEEKVPYYFFLKKELKFQVLLYPQKSQ